MFNLISIFIEICLKMRNVVCLFFIFVIIHASTIVPIDRIQGQKVRWVGQEPDVEVVELIG